MVWVIGLQTQRVPSVGRQAHRWLATLLASICLTLILAGCVGNRTSPSQPWSGVALDGPTGYVGTEDGRVLAIDLERQGLVTASFAAPEAGRTDAFTGFYSTPTIGDNRVYVGGFDGTVFALDAGSLTERGVFKIEGDRLSKGIIGGLALAKNRVVFGAAESAETGRLYVLDSNLRIVCVYPSRGNKPVGAIWSTPTIVDGVAYFGDLAHNLHAVNINDCLPAWPDSVDLGGAIVAQPLVLNGKVYVGTFGQSFYAVDIETSGASVLFEAENWFWAKAAHGDGRAYVPSLDGRLYAVHLAKQSVLWVYPPMENIGSIVSAPVVVNDLVAVASDDEILVVLNSKTGQRIWDQRISDKVRAPLKADGSVVYVHSLDHKLRAYDIVERLLLWERDLEAGS